MFHAIPYILSLIAAICAALPVLLLEPSRTQSAGEIRLVHLLVTWNPAITAILLALGLVLAARSFFRLENRAARAALLIPVAVLGLGTYAARVNVFEKMFAPLPDPGFVAAHQADFLSPHDLVLGVSLGDESKAYPVGIVAYHHIVNDRLSDEPFVVTY
ncbi:MAG: DUF3179 domain-containing protein [Acidobacteria bacterium]|nr:MAG: DUF3179 domain-containing protein [Acidobacteriota bacterium]REK07657.1 MAG: DUF3179 domain-containing protein [Acidobacteriota bacterium]